MTLAFRPADFASPTESHFIVDSWVRATMYAHAAGLIAFEDYFAVKIPQVEKVLHRPSVRTLVAYETDDDTRVADLYGFITAHTGVVPQGLVYFVFVKEPYRRQGVARRLFHAVGIDPSKPFLFGEKTGVVTDLQYKIAAAKWVPLLARERDPMHPTSTRRRR
jgi:GNAT superfamily N-acetyltransferase